MKIFRRENQPVLLSPGLTGRRARSWCDVENTITEVIRIFFDLFLAAFSRVLSTVYVMTHCVLQCTSTHKISRVQMYSPKQENGRGTLEVRGQAIGGTIAAQRFAHNEHPVAMLFGGVRLRRVD